jgi:hypothetical protein
MNDHLASLSQRLAPSRVGEVRGDDVGGVDTIAGMSSKGQIRVLSSAGST